MRFLQSTTCYLLFKITKLISKFDITGSQVKWNILLTECLLSKTYIFEFSDSLRYPVYIHTSKTLFLSYIKKQTAERGVEYSVKTTEISIA